MRNVTFKTALIVGGMLLTAHGVGIAGPLSQNKTLSRAAHPGPSVQIERSNDFQGISTDRLDVGPDGQGVLRPHINGIF